MCNDVVSASLSTMYSSSIICNDKGILNGKIVENPTKTLIVTLLWALMHVSLLCSKTMTRGANIITKLSNHLNNTLWGQH
jgi:hypothetical protein